MSIRKLAAALLAALSSIPLSPPTGAAESSRAVVIPYSGMAGIHVAGRTEYVDVLGSAPDVVARARSRERAARIEVRDESGFATYAAVWGEKRGGRPRFLGSLCGTSEEALPLRGFARVMVDVYSGVCDNATPAAATRGEVEITFLRQAGE